MAGHSNRDAAYWREFRRQRRAQLEGREPWPTAGSSGPRPMLTSSGSYSTLHRRVQKARGKANEYLCEGCCGGQATDWARIHGRSGRDVNDYVPACHRCHLQYDFGKAKANV